MRQNQGRSEIRVILSKIASQRCRVANSSPHLWCIIVSEYAVTFMDGSVAGGTLDASNLLKPVFASGKIRCIGSTTFDEYGKIFEKDRALARRFQKIDVL